MQKHLGIGQGPTIAIRGEPCASPCFIPSMMLVSPAVTHTHTTSLSEHVHKLCLYGTGHTNMEALIRHYKACGLEPKAPTIVSIQTFHLEVRCWGQAVPGLPTRPLLGSGECFSHLLCSAMLILRAHDSDVRGDLTAKSEALVVAQDHLTHVMTERSY